MKGFSRPLLIAAGALSLSVGVVGILLPVLPTTPFLLLTAACWLRSSKRLHDWLLGHPFFGSHLRGYLQHRAVPLRTKIGALVFLWASLGLSAVLVNSLHVQIALGVVGVAVTVHLVRLKTLRQDDGKDA